MSSRRSPCPYQPVTVTRCHPVFGSARRWSSVGWPRAGHARAPLGARQARRRRVEQAGVEPQPGDHGHMAAHGCEQLNDGVAAVGDGYDLPVRQPARDQEQQLPCAIRQQLVPASLGLGVALGGRQGGEERQSPDPPGERHGREQHQTDPAQARRLDEVAAAGAHGVAVDAARLDPCTPAALDGLVDANHDRSVRHEGRDQQPEQAARRGLTRPAAAVEHAVVVGEARRPAQAHAAQRRGNGAPARGQDGACGKHQQVGPGRAGEASGERRHPGGEKVGVVKVGLACHGGLAVVSLPPDNSARARRINRAVQQPHAGAHRGVQPGARRRRHGA